MIAHSKNIYVRRVVSSFKNYHQYTPSNWIQSINFCFMIYLETCSTQFNPVTNFSRLILIKLCLTNGFVGIFPFAIFIKFTPNRQRWMVGGRGSGRIMKEPICNIGETHRFRIIRRAGQSNNILQL